MDPLRFLFPAAAAAVPRTVTLSVVETRLFLVAAKHERATMMMIRETGAEVATSLTYPTPMVVVVVGRRPVFCRPYFLWLELPPKPLKVMEEETD